jgi:hypothetical protein
MTPRFVTLFTRPDQAWEGIRRQEEADSRHYLGHLLLLALIPCVSLFIGTTVTGWSLVENERVRLDLPGALQLCVLLYATIIIGVFIQGFFIRWMSRSFDTRPNFNQCVGFVAYTITPFLIVGLAALWPNRWFAAVVLLAAGVYSTYLLFIGLPAFMRLRSSQSFLFAASAWGVALLTMVTSLIFMILIWRLALEPEYDRTNVQNQSYGFEETRPQEAPGGVDNERRMNERPNED